MNQERVRWLVTLACLGIAACGPEDSQLRQGHEAEAENEQGVKVVAFVTDEEDFSTQPVRFHARGSFLLKDGTTVTLAVVDEDSPSPDSGDALAAEDDASKAR